MKNAFRLLFLILCAQPIAARAGIDFESTEVTANAKPTDESVDVIFKFKISGDKPVRINDIESHCGCLQGSVAQQVYEPGSTGEVLATFKVGATEGPLSKGLSVFTDDPAHKEIPLICTVVVPVVFEFDTKLVTWHIGDPCETKTIKLKIRQDDPIHITKVESSREHVKAVLKEIKAGFEYEIELTPTNTTDYTLGAAFISTDCKLDKYKTRQIFFNITPKPDAPKPLTPPPPPPPPQNS